MGSSETIVEDPCGAFGPDQKRALAWFFFMLFGGSFLVYKLSGIDLWMYSTGGDLLNYADYRENRLAATSIGSESIDPREAASVPAAGAAAHPPEAGQH